MTRAGEIVAAATQLFTERGVGGTTMAEIARRCGLQQPSLYYYFRSKGELLDEIVGEAESRPARAGHAGPGRRRLVRGAAVPA